MEKAPDAFRTISEVAEVLDTPAHVLRFWESRFPQIRPVKRAGGRRYYRPGDVALLAGIRHLLHDQGLTIRGVQKVLRESGVRHVQAMARGKVIGLADVGEPAEIEAALELSFLADVEPEAISATDGAEVVALPRRKRSAKAAARLREDTPPPANAPCFAEDVPEAPFIEAEEAEPAKADVLHLTSPGAPRRRSRAPQPEPEDLPLLARMAEWDQSDEERLAEDRAEQELADQALAEQDLSAEDLADLAALDGGTPASVEADPDAAETAPAETPAETPASPADSDEPAAAATGPSLSQRLRALPRPVSPETAAALAPLLTRARALQARLAPPSTRRT
jgi:DNA-binding transcriptional MerR regulator